MALHTIVEHETAHTKPYIDAKVTQLTQALNDEAVTRSKLGAHNLFDNATLVTGNESGSSPTTRVSNRGSRDLFFKSGESIVVTANNTVQKVLFIFNSSYVNTGSIAPSGGYTTSDIAYTTTQDCYIIIGFKKSDGSDISITDVKNANPMVRLASDADTTYRPYSPTNSQLLSYKENGILGAKNLFNLSIFQTKKILSGVTCSIDAPNGTVSYHRSTTSSSNFYWVSDETFRLKAGTYILSATCSIANVGKIGIAVGGSVKASLGDTGSAILTLSSDTDVKLYAFYLNTATADVTISNIMLRLASDTDTTYQPYAMTNQQLTTQYNSLTNSLSAKITQAYYDAVTGDKEDASVHTTAFESMIPTTVGSTVIGLIRYSNGFFSTCIITRNKNNEANAIEFNPTSFLSGKHTAMWIGGLSSGTWTWTLKFSS